MCRIRGQRKQSGLRIDPIETMNYTQTDRILALAATLEIDAEAVDPTTYCPEEFEAEGGSYLVLTYDEAKAETDERLADYCDECVISGVPEELRFYFDTDAWKRDQWLGGLNMGEWLATYDHMELDSPCLQFLIYRTN